MSYASPQDLLDRYDARRVGDLATDSGTRLTESQILADSKVSTCMEDASGALIAAIKRGNRYTDDDLSLLSGPSLSFLKRVVCDLSFAYLVMRRGYGADEVSAQAPGYKSAQEILKKLQDGELVFDLGSQKSAGTPSFTIKTYSVDGESQLPSSTAKRLFGMK